MTVEEIFVRTVLPLTALYRKKDMHILLDSTGK